MRHQLPTPSAIMNPTIAQVSRDRQVVSRQLFRELSIYYISDGLSVYFGLLPRIILVIPCYSSRYYSVLFIFASRGVNSLRVQHNFVVVRNAVGAVIFRSGLIISF